MKRLFLIIVFFKIILINTAQVVQLGVIKEYNSNGKSVSGVGVSILTATDVQPSVSDNDGFFRLNFSKLKAGDVIYNFKIVKSGYEIVNTYDFKNGWTLSSKDTMKVIIAKKGLIDEVRSRYYEIIDKYKESEYRETIAELKNQLAKLN